MGVEDEQYIVWRPKNKLDIHEALKKAKEASEELEQVLNDKEMSSKITLELIKSYLERESLRNKPDE